MGQLKPHTQYMLTVASGPSCTASYTNQWHHHRHSYPQRVYRLAASATNLGGQHQNVPSNHQQRRGEQSHKRRLAYALPPAKKTAGKRPLLRCLITLTPARYLPLFFFISLYPGPFGAQLVPGINVIIAAHAAVFWGRHLAPRPQLFGSDRRCSRSRAGRTRAGVVRACRDVGRGCSSLALTLRGCFGCSRSFACSGDRPRAGTWFGLPYRRWGRG